jgi:light-harvesting complex I chlorophyll a/b binding protein 5
MGAAGVLGTSILHAAGTGVPSWFDAGKVSAERTGIPGGALFVVQMIMYNFVEIKRLQDFRKPGSQAEAGSFFGLESVFKGTGDMAAIYPGGPMFDPLGLSKGPSADAMKLREVKNGRLAMVACLGFGAQWAATGKDPLVNLAEHLKNPAATNFATNGVSLPFDNPIPGYL